MGHHFSNALVQLLRGELRCEFQAALYEDVCRYYRQLIHTTPTDLLALCSVLEDITAENTICVVAGQSQIDACGDMLTNRRAV